MFTKSTIALAIVVGITSGALAVTTKKHSANPAWDVYDSAASMSAQIGSAFAWSYCATREHGVNAGHEHSLAAGLRLPPPNPRSCRQCP